MNNNIDEKLSALYDGELDANEIDEVLSMLDKDTNLQKKLSTYALMSSSINNLNNVQSIKSNSKVRNYSFWFSNSITAAATVLLTLFAINQFDFSRMSEDISAKNQLNIAMSSKEAKEIVSKAEENLVDHVMHVINNPDIDNSTPYDIDLRNVGYNRMSSNGRMFNKGNKNFSNKMLEFTILPTHFHLLIKVYSHPKNFPFKKSYFSVRINVFFY